jgi:hypothetical protein
VKKKFLRRPISIYGKGEMGIVALYAGLFDERVKQVILNDAPGSHWQGPALLNVLRVTDISEVAGLFAPRRLVSLTKLPESFEARGTYYRLQRASDQFAQSSSLPEALEIWKYPSGSRALDADKSSFLEKAAGADLVRLLAWRVCRALRGLPS